jgi:group I intron endonuclease
MKKYLVYKAISPSKKVYIGITCRKFSVRKNEHIYDATVRNKKRPFCCAIRKYGKQIEWSILESNVSEEQAKQFEMSYIKEFKKVTKVYNVTAGGDTSWNAGLTGFKRSIESIIKQQAARKGYSHSQETRNKISTSNTGKVYTKETIEKSIKSKNSEPVLVYKLDGSFVGEWLNKAECSRDLGLLHNKIHDCINGVVSQHRGYKFKLKSQSHFSKTKDNRFKKRDEDTLIKIARLSVDYNIKTSQNEIFESFYEFRKRFNLTPKRARTCINKGQLNDIIIHKIPKTISE